MKKIKGLVLLALLAAPLVARAEDVAFRLGENDFLIPFKQVSAVQLYSFEEGKGFPAVETVLAARKSWKVSVGAASVLGSGVNVPFVSVATRLSPRFFDIGDNDLYFGAWVGKPSRGERVLYGVSASTKLW